MKYLHVITSTCIHARTQNCHFCILGSTYIDNNRKWLCSLLWRWLESIITINQSGPWQDPKDGLTREEGHRTQEEGGKAPPVGIQADGSLEVRLAYQVARTASEVLQTLVGPLLL
jgi:hypothetical protein